MKAHGNQMTREEFVRRGREKHGDKYSYKKVKYSGCNPKVILGCRTCRVWFTTNARTHIRNGSAGGCPSCKKSNASLKLVNKAKAKFVARARQLHGNKFKYEQDEYAGYYKPVNVTCTACDRSFSTTPERHFRRADGDCATCAQVATKLTATERFVEKARKMHGDLYSYKKVDYIGARADVIIGCRTCRSWFKQTPAQHLRGRGCRKCGGGERSTTEAFIAKARKVHGESYDYSKVEYHTAREKVEIICRECDVSFMQIPNSHLNGSGCPHCCRPHAHSKLSIKWLEYEAKKRGIKIKHARNGGEFQIPGTRYRADGYHAKSNTVFEFYGDIFHGNPKRYKPSSRPNPYTTKTAGKLYKETMEREELLRGLGYTVMSMWQSDFRQMIREGLV